MDDTSRNSPFPDSIASPLRTEPNLVVDPKLLTKALNKMRGLIKGNGIDENTVILCETPEETNIKMYRFKAKTALKLVPHYGIKVEPGRNTAAELMPNESEFKKAISNIASTARTDPKQRKQVIDFMYARTDKGFGIKEQRTKFHMLSRDFVQHEKCLPCANTGRVVCAKCHGKAVMPCTKCIGRRHIPCPRCRGDGKILTNKGTVPCRFCRGDGRINCNLCGARGQIKCQGCAATGTTACKTCAASGWMSHLAHIEMFAQITFDFERETLPYLLVQSIEKNPSRCVEKHEIEVSLVKPRSADNSLDDMGRPRNQILNPDEPEDTIWIDYDALCPFGSVTFQIGETKLSGSLFGFQTRLLEFPYFMDDIIKYGQTALIAASQQKKNTRGALLKAAKYRLIADIIAQTLWIKNPAKTKRFLQEKYPTGINPETLTHLVDVTDLTLRNITRLWRTLGLVIGLMIFSCLIGFYFLEGGREDIKNVGLPELALVPLDILLIPLGILMGVFSSKLAARWSQNRTLHKIVPDTLLKSTLPKAGKTLHWSAVISIIFMMVFLVLAVMGGQPIPIWLSFLILQIPAGAP